MRERKKQKAELQAKQQQQEQQNDQDDKEQQATKRLSKGVRRVSEISHQALQKAHKMKRCSDLFERMGNIQAQRMRQIGQISH